MKVLTYDRVRVETGFAIESLRELEVNLVPGRHGTAWIRGFADAETATAKLQSQLKNSQVKVFEVDENGAQVGKPIFEGIVLDAEVGEENGYTEVKINAVTGTILLDMEKKSRSFQNVDMTYRDVVKKVLEDTEGAHGIFTVGMEKKIKKPLIQFEETDWQFIRRLVSHFSSELIPEVEMCRPNFWFGMRESSATADFSDNMYDVHVDGKYYDMGGDAIGLKRADYLYYSVVGGQNLSIGDKVTFRDKSLIIGEKYAKFERGELLFHYKLCRPAYVGIKPYYNEKVCGLSLPGTVRKTEKEVLYIDLDIDKDREKGVLYHYAWVPTTGNLMYCMPKIGTRVFLYIPDHDERHAMSTSCIRTNGKQHPQMADYHNRYFTTEHYKQMNMLPESMALIGVGEMEKPLSITMHDSMGISVSSHKTIVLRAGKGISISGKNVVFKTQRELRVIQGLGGTAKIEICNKIDVDAPKTKVKMTYHSATGRSQEKPSPDEDALAKVLMFVMGAAMITCVTAKSGLGPVGAMIGAMAARVLPRITTGSGQIMMITGAAVPTLVADALKRLAEMLAVLRNKLIGPNKYWPYSIIADQPVPKDDLPNSEKNWWQKFCEDAQLAWEFHKILFYMRHKDLIDFSNGIYDTLDWNFANNISYRQVPGDTKHYENGQKVGNVISIPLWIIYSVYGDLASLLGPTIPVGPPSAGGGADSVVVADGYAYIPLGLWQKLIAENAPLKAFDGFINAKSAEDIDNGKNSDNPPAEKSSALDGKDDIITDGSHYQNGKLKPNSKYQTGEFDYIYETDDLGRIEKFSTDDLRLTDRADRLNHNPNTLGKQHGDHAGHIVGDRFGGSAELDNLISQSSSANLSSYKKIENKWAKAITEGKEVTVDITISYDSTGLRPVSFDIEYTIDGKLFSTVIKN